MFSFLELLFQARNDRLHKNDDTNNERKNLEIKIQELQNENFTVPIKLNRLYHTTYEQLTNKNKSITHLRRWVRTFQVCKKINYDENKHRPKHTSDIRKHINIKNVSSALDNNRIPNIHTRFDHRKRKRRRVPDPIDPICAYLTVKRVCNPR